MSDDHDEEQQRQALADIRRELADDHYRRTTGARLRALAAVMRAEVAAQPGVIRLDTRHHCHLCGQPVGDEARSPRNPNLFLCPECRSRFKPKVK